VYVCPWKQLWLENLTVIVDRNRLQQGAGTEETAALDPLDEKWRAFGWEVETVDGHDHAHLLDVLEPRRKGRGRPPLLQCIASWGSYNSVKVTCRNSILATPPLCNWMAMIPFEGTEASVSVYSDVFTPLMYSVWWFPFTRTI